MIFLTINHTFPSGWPTS